MRSRQPAEEKLRPITVYVLPKVYDEIEAVAKRDRRSISSTATFMLEHAIQCHMYKQGHVPVDQIPSLRGQGTKK